jgi:hypothetical protein
MATTRTGAGKAGQPQAFDISHKALVAIVAGFFDTYRPNPDDPAPPGPWDPVIRAAFDRTIRRFDRVALNPQPLPPVALVGLNPQPEPPGSLSRLNPQPLPPVAVFAAVLAEEVVDRAGLIQRTAGKGGNAGVQFLAEFVDDWCGTGRPKVPRPKKRPAVELLTLGAMFHRLAESVGDDALRQGLVEGGNTLLQTGVAQL